MDKSEFEVMSPFMQIALTPQTTIKKDDQESDSDVEDSDNEDNTNVCFVLL